MLSNRMSCPELSPSVSCCCSQVQDAQATMRLYTLVKKKWEAEIKTKQSNKDSAKKNKRKPKFPKKKDK